MPTRDQLIAAKIADLRATIYHSPGYIDAGNDFVVRFSDRHPIDLHAVAADAVDSDLAMQKQAAAHRGAITSAASAAASQAGQRAELAQSASEQVASNIAAINAGLLPENQGIPATVTEAGMASGLGGKWLAVGAIFGLAAWVLNRKKRRR